MDEPPKFTKIESGPSSKTALVFAVSGAICTIGLFLYAFLAGGANNPYRAEILKDHYAALIGIPGAASVAFIIVVFLRQTEGPIEFKGLGFEFKGASGQVAMWAVCFLVIVVAIKLVW